jgi:hypothetical protein
MNTIRYAIGRHVLSSLFAGLAAIGLFTGVQAPAHADSKHLLTFEYQCAHVGSSDGGGRETISRVNTTIRLFGSANHDDEFCGLSHVSGFSQEACATRRSAMREAILRVDDDCVVTDAVRPFNTNGNSLEILCVTKKEKRLFKILDAACGRILGTEDK